MPSRTRFAQVARLAPLGLTVGLSLALATTTSDADAATRSLDDYRHFRALSIDLVGRMPTRDEIVAFEKDDFDIDAFIGKHVESDAYVERLSRIYFDQLRLEVSPAFNFTPPATTLRRVTIQGPDGKPLHVFYRQNQRRVRPETDGEFCLSEAEIGLYVPMNNKQPEGNAKAVDAKALDAATVLVKPWWLYRDYRNAAPVLHYGDTWGTVDPGYQPVETLLKEPDGTPTVAVRVCREEAQAADTGTLYVSGRDKPQPGAKYGRKRPLPPDDNYAKKHKGEPISCHSSAAVSMSVDCGCGVGLENCMPGDSTGNNDVRAFVFPTRYPLGLAQPLSTVAQSESAWHKLWWSQEAGQYMRHLFGEDRDFREILTGKWTYVNGPLAQFYRSTAPATCCGQAKAFGLIEATEPLFDPKSVPSKLAPHDVGDWEKVDDRGPNAAGIVTMPVFLTKYASRRARGAALYNTFLCKSFVAGNVMLKPSTEPNLMKRDGCSTCHATLEPLAAYFSRVVETDWTFLPKTQFPLENPLCKKNPQGNVPGYCRNYYDPAFADASHGTLFGAYAAPDHAEAGPIGAAIAIANDPQFATCAVERVTSSFLGRQVGPDDDALMKSLVATFTAGGYKMKPLVKALLRSDAYQHANNWSSSVLRKEVASSSANGANGGGK